MNCSKNPSASSPETTLKVLSARVLKPCGTPALAISSRNSGEHLARRMPLVCFLSAASVRMASLSVSDLEDSWVCAEDPECPLAMDRRSALSMSGWWDGVSVRCLCGEIFLSGDLRERDEEEEPEVEA